MSNDLKGKTSIITGAASGIGKATAIAMSELGSNIVVVDLSSEQCDETVEIIRSKGGVAVTCQADVTKEEEVELMIEKTLKTFGQLDVAFNNAGIGGSFKKTDEYSISEWNQVISVNLTGVWLCMKHQIKEMLKKERGSIINTASVAGLIGMGSAPAYTAAKHGVIGITKNAAIEYAKKGIRINAICPGLVKTAMTDYAESQLPGFLEKTTQLEPIGRIAQPEEMANAVIWLASDSASYVTGHAMAVDGGLVAQ